MLHRSLFSLQILLLGLLELKETRSQGREGSRQIPGCNKTFAVKSNTIIRSKDSQENGAVFIQELEELNLGDCIRFCCSTPFCDVAVYGRDTSCYLFACDIMNSDKCEFSSHEDFESALVTSDGTSRVSDSSRSRNTSSSVQQKSDSGGRSNLKNIEDCGRYQFSCGSGECIAIYDSCNGIPQCGDGSDEDPEYCGTTTTSTTRPPPSPHRSTTLRPGVQHPFRENNRSQERGEGRSVSKYPTWYKNLPDKQRHHQHDNKPSQELFRALNDPDPVIEEIGDKINQTEHSVMFSLSFIVMLAVLSLGLLTGYKNMRNRGYLYRRVLLSSDESDFYEGLTM